MREPTIDPWSPGGDPGLSRVIMESPVVSRVSRQVQLLSTQITSSFYTDSWHRNWPARINPEM